MVKIRFVFLAVLLLATALAVPAVAQSEIYDNGPINGTTDAWTLNFGFAVSDSFTLAGGNTTITGLTFGSFTIPGDVLTSVELSITSSEFGGTSYFDQVVGITQSDCVSNQYGYNVCHQDATFNGPTLANGTYWLTLQNATTNTGDPVYWDENSGAGCESNGCPSLASENTIGTIPSESFTLYGNASTGSGTGPGSTPEPSSIMLLGSGLLSVVGVLRRELF